jgi:5-methylcytosine-specific restriction endonuclease McrA
MTKRSVKTLEDERGISYQTMYYHRERFKIICMLGGTCSQCGTVDSLDIHHIHGHDLPKGRPTAARIRDWKQGLVEDNLLLLCADCHKAEHTKRDFNTNHP